MISQTKISYFYILLGVLTSKRQSNLVVFVRSIYERNVVNKAERQVIKIHLLLSFSVILKFSSKILSNSLDNYMV